MTQKENGRSPRSARGIDNVAYVLGYQENDSTNYMGARIPLEAINIFPQVRQTFEEIEDLAENIADHGLFNPLTVAKFDRESCQHYIAVINWLWGRDFSLDQTVSCEEDGQEVFYVLLAGERRHRACMYLKTAGCPSCQQQFGAGPCHTRHPASADGQVDVRLCVNISPLEALFRQIAENVHMRVPAHEEAKVFYELYSLVKQADPKYSLAQFSRDVSRGPDTIKNAIRFCELPAEIQGFVKNRVFSYGIACEISRLHEAGFSEDDLSWWARQAAVSSPKVDEFRETISKVITDRNNGQTMLDLFTQEQESEMRRLAHRRVVARELIQILWRDQYYLKKVQELLKDGKLGRDDSPFSILSPVRYFRASIALRQELLPLLKDHLPKAFLAEAEQILSDNEQVLAVLEVGLAPTESGLADDPFVQDGSLIR
ncbi:hypothetical protein HY388_01025 [Candidatus Daviesbacteria bacterium]|nr:hypothetical protein [Candidatus Daviesbacteria bacterium]